MEANNNWLKKAIAQGFMMLAALNLKGRPASADLTAVAELWLGILSGRSWQPEQDGIRIQAAFRAIAASSSEWPNPADLIKHLPPPEIRMVPRLEKKHQPTEYGKAQSAELKKIVGRLKNAPCMNRDWIHGPRHRSVDECQRIYAERQKGKEMNDWKNLNDELPCIGWICDVLLPDGTIIENVEAVEVDDDNAFMPEVGFKKYPEATHFRKSK